MTTTTTTTTTTPAATAAATAAAAAAARATATVTTDPRIPPAPTWSGHVLSYRGNKVFVLPEQATECQQDADRLPVTAQTQEKQC